MLDEKPVEAAGSNREEDCSRSSPPSYSGVFYSAVSTAPQSQDLSGSEEKRKEADIVEDEAASLVASPDPAPPRYSVPPVAQPDRAICQTLGPLKIHADLPKFLKCPPVSAPPPATAPPSYAAAMVVCEDQPQAGAPKLHSTVMAVNVSQEARQPLGKDSVKRFCKTCNAEVGTGQMRSHASCYQVWTSVEHQFPWLMLALLLCCFCPAACIACFPAFTKHKHSCPCPACR